MRLVDGPADAGVAVLFADDAATARQVLSAHRDAVTTPPVVWVAYPKAGRSDVNRDTLWPIVAEFGLRPNGQVAIDDVWSALRFRASRPGEPPFTGGGRGWGSAASARPSTIIQDRPHAAGVDPG